MKCIKLSRNVFDIFILDGWENWSRWYKDNKGFIKQIGGETVPGFIKAMCVKKITEVK